MSETQPRLEPPPRSVPPPLHNPELLSKVVEETADCVVITNRDGVIEYVNPAFEVTTGYCREEVIGANPKLLRSGVHDREFYRRLWSTLLDGRVHRATITNRKKNGDLFVSQQTITPMRNSAGRITHFVSVAKDITDLQKATQRESQLMLARSLQQKRYPVDAPRIEGFDIAGAAVPADITGGDYFDYLPLGDECLGIAIGDASGHGFHSSLRMAETRAYLRSVGQSSADPAEILSRINRLLVNDTPHHCYVTMFVGALDAAQQTLRYASAGHVSGYVVGPSGSVRRELRSTGIPLGIFADRSFASGPPVTFEPGELVALLTDGVTEAEAPDGTLFGADRALAVIRDRRQQSARRIVAELFRAVRDFVRGRTLTDDMTAVVCKTAALGHDRLSECRTRFGPSSGHTSSCCCTTR
jgi:PAS domain S-box-containing protein